MIGPTQELEFSQVNQYILLPIPIILLCYGSFFFIKNVLQLEIL